MKKFLVILTIILFFILFIRFEYISYKSKDVLYTAQRYATHNLSMNYKLNYIDNFTFNYNDKDIAIISLTGTTKKVPHDAITCKLLLSRENSGKWSVLRFFIIVST